jgi:hypothetical protein
VDYERWRKNGTLWETREAGGKYATYFESGLVQSTGTILPAPTVEGCDRFCLDGEWVYYNEDGSIKRVEQWKDGVNLTEKAAADKKENQRQAAAEEKERQRKAAAEAAKKQRQAQAEAADKRRQAEAARVEKAAEERRFRASKEGKYHWAFSALTSDMTEENVNATIDQYCEGEPEADKPDCYKARDTWFSAR